MKKLIIAVLSITIVLSMTSCAKSDSGKTENSTAAESTTVETTLLTGTFSEKDLAFPYEGQGFALLSDVSVLLTAIGEGYEVKAAPSCSYVGEDKTFTYPGLEIMTNPIDGKDLINEMIVTGEDFVTPRGIRIGDTREAVIAAYGEGFDDQGTLTYVVSGDFEDYESDRMFISIKDGKVEYISYFSGISFR